MPQKIRSQATLNQMKVYGVLLPDQIHISSIATDYKRLNKTIEEVKGV